MVPKAKEGGEDVRGHFRPGPWGFFFFFAKNDPEFLQRGFGWSLLSGWHKPGFW